MNVFEKSSSLPGKKLPKPPWGQQEVLVSPLLKKSIKKQKKFQNKLALILGAGGSLGPDFVNALKLQGYQKVVGVDLCLTYYCRNCIYRKVDLSKANQVQEFFKTLRKYLEKNNLKLGPIYDLATLQVNPREETDRARLYRGKKFIFDELGKFAQNIKYFYMSTAEVYGISQPPFKETSSKKPFNPYGKEKLKEEKYCLSRHGQKTKKGKVYVTGLRTFLIAMANYDAEGKIISSRNYAGSKIILGAKLFELGIKPPLVNKNFLGQIHLSEDVTGISIKMAGKPLDSKIWGQIFNCPGDPVSFGKMLETAFLAYHEGNPPQNLLVKMINAVTQFEIPRFVIVVFAKIFEKLPQISGVRNLSWRIPYMFQSYYLDSSQIEEILGESNHVSTVEAVKIFTKSIRSGGPDDLIFKRYDLY